MRFPRALLLAAALLAAVCALPYLAWPVYDFPQPRPFSGPIWYNPYASLDGQWHKVNFHAHTRAWGGMSDGLQAASEVQAAYRALRFEVAAISNYHAIDATDSGHAAYVPAYRHGYSLFKTHRLVIGAREVDWLDFPLGQTVHRKQFVLDRLRPSGALLAIGHPRIRGGHTAEDLRWLGNYNLIEAVNTLADSIEEWDSALSSGHAAWIVGGDDNHDVGDRLGFRWNMVNAESAASNDVLDAVRRGRHVAVRGSGAIMENGLQQLAVHDGRISVKLERPASAIVFKGQGGQRLAAVANAASATYTAAPADTYVGIEIQAPASTLYLNPVVRWDGRALPAPRPTLNLAATWSVRGLLAACYAGLIWLAWRALRRRPA